MRRTTGFVLGLTLVSASVLGCAADEKDVADPQPFCDTVERFQEASVAAADAALNSGDAATGNLAKELQPLIVPLERVQSTLPSDAPADVKEAVGIYLRALQAEAGADNATDPAVDPGDVVSEESETTSETTVTEESDGTTESTTVTESETTTETVVSEDDLQRSAKVLEGYLDQECPHTMPSQGSEG